MHSILRLELNSYLCIHYYIPIEMSETPIAETSEEDVKDEDWHPGSEELMLETEEGSMGAELDSGLDTSKEEDKKGEMKAVDDDDANDISSLESEVLLESSPLKIMKLMLMCLAKHLFVNVLRLLEQETKMVMMEQKKLLQKEIKVVIQKLPEDKAILLTGLLISKGVWI